MKDEENDYGLQLCLETLRAASGRALDLQIQGINDPRLTAARRLINAKNVLNLWLKTESLHHQHNRLTVPLNKPDEVSETPLPAVVFKLHQQKETNNETN